MEGEKVGGEVCSGGDEEMGVGGNEAYANGVLPLSVSSLPWRNEWILAERW